MKKWCSNLQLETRRILEGLTRRITLQGYSLKTALNRIVCDKCWLVQLIPSQFGSRLNSCSGGYSSRLRVRSSLQEWGTNSSDIQLIPTSTEPKSQNRSFFVRIFWHSARALCPKQILVPSFTKQWLVWKNVYVRLVTFVVSWRLISAKNCK